MRSIVFDDNHKILTLAGLHKDFLVTLSLCVIEWLPQGLPYDCQRVVQVYQSMGSGLSVKLKQPCDYIHLSLFRGDVKIHRSLPLTASTNSQRCHSL